MPNELCLVQGGAPRFCVEVRPSQDAEAARDAVEELVEHLDCVLDAPLVWFDRRAKSLPPVRLTLEVDVLADLGREAFEIEATDDRLRVRARTAIGLEHGVHCLLERAFGVRWLWPGESGTVLPRAENVTWPLGRETQEPAWLLRRLWLGGAFWREDDPYLAELKYGRVRPATLRELTRWQRRNRLGGLRIADGHRWAEICSPLVHAESHPEYFALVGGERDTRYVDGKHGNQPCTSNPDVVRLTADYIKAQFRAKPELDAFSLAANDGRGFCECDACRAIDDWAGAGGHEANELDAATAEGPGVPPGGIDRALTDRMLKFANDVAEQVAEEFPNKLLLVLVYSVYRTPPKRVKLHPNVIAQFCTSTWSYVSEDVYAREMDILSGLASYTEKRGVYDYFVNGANGAMPRGFAWALHRALRGFHERGCRYFATQAGLDFATGGFAYYLAARCLWDADLAFEDVLDDYCASGFGPGAEAVRRFLAAYVRRWEETRAGKELGETRMEGLAPKLYPPAWRLARRAELEEALALCDGAEAERARFLREGLDFLDRLCEACEGVARLKAAGAPDDAEAAATWAAEAPDRQMIADALLRRRRLLDWVDARRDGFHVTAMWFDYQRFCRRGDLGAWMDAIARGAS